MSSSELKVPSVEPVELPDTFSAAWAVELGRRLDAATRQRVPLKRVFAPETAEALFAAATKLLIKEPTLLEVCQCVNGHAPDGRGTDLACGSACMHFPESVRCTRRCCCVQIAPPSPTATFTVIGDTHGQLHDVIGPL